MSKPKQQKTLLSFFSSPPNAAAKKPAATPASAANSKQKATPKTTSSTSKAAKPASAARAEEKEANTRKRISFSPKLKKRSDEEDADGDDDVVMQDAVSSTSGTKRKAYEDFLGTDSEEEDESAAKKAESKVVSQPPKQARRTPTKVIVDDDDGNSDSDASEPATTPQKRMRRKRISTNVVSSDDDEEEWDPKGAKGGGDGDNDNDSEFSANASDDTDDDDEEDEEDEEDDEPVRPAKRRKATVTPTKPAAKKSAPAKKAGAFLSPPPSSIKKSATTPSSSAKKSSGVGASLDASNGGGDVVAALGTGTHIHDSLPFLHEKRRDINGNMPDSPDYDPRTLYVPPEFIKKETPAMVQWWEVKSRNMDTVLFFKVGKFYELFHMDADVGFKELNLIYMKGDKAHSGFPEIAYSKMSSQLVEKGYRVARVEQTETPEMMKERNAGSATKSKVVRREICSLLSVGTNTSSFLDAPISSQEQVSRKLVAVKEDWDAASKSLRFGICMIDSSTGAFHLAEFDDTEQRDRLKTLFAQFHVVEIVSERGGLSDDTKMVLKHAAPAAIRSELRVSKEFWDATRTIDEIERAGYFKESGWPANVLDFLEMDKTVKSDGQLVISALGGCIWHLRRSIIDQELLSLCNFSRYKPADEEAREQRENAGALATSKVELTQHFVVLDSQTIQNLEILTNNFNGSRAGSLIDIMDKTVTSFGKRMFQEWVVKPLCKVSEINERLDAVDELGQQHELMTEVRDYLRKLPDLERLLSRIHALGSAHRSKEHPDSRAIMYESNTYNIRKIRNFVAVLNGFDVAMELVQGYGARFSQFSSPILQGILKTRASGKEEDVCTANSLKLGHFPDLRAKLEFFQCSFDHSVAQKSGVIVPPEGFDPEYDDACADIARVEGELQEYLAEQRTALRCKQIVYWGTKKDDRFQLEVPESAVSSKQPKEYELKSRKKGYKRFHTPTIRGLLAQLVAAETRKEEALKDQMRKVFHRFDGDYKYWLKAVQCLAVLDCLLSLALVSSQSDGYTKPEIVSAAVGNNGVPFIDIEEGVHPCVAATFDGDFIPNDAQLGVSGHGQMVLLSGPNMGGKSTLLRQTCVLALMAQIGCFVPAQKCRMSPVDRIFTRIGASDRILAGQSTLYVELAETATILNHATNHSLVILDELGRGTSTFDGTAIAYSVVEHLLREIRCRSMFATHYHSLVEEYAEHEQVSLGHMGCIVDPDNDRKVTFLYKLKEGMCPKSYGLNVAMLAKLPDEVIECAARKSAQFEQSLQAKAHAAAGGEEADVADIVAQVQQLLKQGKEVDIEQLTALWRTIQARVR
uniref:DNA mismatch repair protein n=1 Tax=Globisporangium ultimum (strain ATCC 200006 / CBS 805.95 / DAOM BR144) TaxID=431595 RepID=K3W7B0_GLOUD